MQILKNFVSFYRYIFYFQNFPIYGGLYTLFINSARLPENEAWGASWDMFTIIAIMLRHNFAYKEWIFLKKKIEGSFVNSKILWKI